MQQLEPGTCGNLYQAHAATMYQPLVTPLVLVFALLLREQLGEPFSTVIKLLLSGKLSVINIVPSWQWDVCILPYFAVQS
jgi:hypothetical protein